MIAFASWTYDITGVVRRGVGSGPPSGWRWSDASRRFSLFGLLSQPTWCAAKAMHVGRCEVGGCFKLLAHVCDVSGNEVFRPG